MAQAGPGPTPPPPALGVSLLYCPQPVPKEGGGLPANNTLNSPEPYSRGYFNSPTMSLSLSLGCQAVSVNLANVELLNLQEEENITHHATKLFFATS